ncbi:MAG: ankyrin repeat domain-containing protein [Planctomycetota bacterium]
MNFHPRQLLYLFAYVLLVCIATKYFLVYLENVRLQEAQRLVARGDSKRLEALLKQHPQLVRKVDHFEKTLLHEVAELTTIGTKSQDEILVAKVLLDQGADLNAMDITGNTPLHLAVLRSKEPLVKLFLERKALVDQPDERGWTALHMAARTGHGPIVTMLLARGADVDKRNRQGWTPVELALAAGYRPLALLMLEKSIDEDKKNRYRLKDFEREESLEDTRPKPSPAAPTSSGQSGDGIRP